MLRRFLRGGLLSAALFGMTPLTSAKPPDLPADVKNVVTPQEPAAGAEPSIFEPWFQLCDPETADQETPFYRLHLAERKAMTSCLLFGVHPLLALAPVDEVMYWPMELREAMQDAVAGANEKNLGRAWVEGSSPAPVPGATSGANTEVSPFEVPVPPPEMPTGLLRIGIGVSTNGGVTGSVDVHSGVPTRSITFGLGMNSDGGLMGNVDLNITADEVKSGFMSLLQRKLRFGVGVNSDSGLTGEIVLNERNFEILPAPKESCESACPFMRRAQPAPVVAVPERTVLENLKALEEGEQLLEQGKEMLRTGRLCEALDYCEKVARLCPGSRYDEMAHVLIGEVFKQWPAASEEAEEATQEEENAPCFEGFLPFLKMCFPFLDHSANAQTERMNELLNTSEDIRPILEGWERPWLIDRPSHLSYDRIHRGIQEVASEEPDEPCKVEFFGTPFWRIVCDILCGQGLNLYPEKPPAPTEQGEEQETHFPQAKDAARCALVEKDALRHLNMPVELQYRDVPLPQVLADLRNAYGLDIVLDERALADKGVTAAERVTFSAHNVALGSVLGMILRNQGLTYVVHDGVVEVTTPEAARGRPVVSAYRVADLVVGDNGGETPLIRVITNTVAPAGWAVRGGAGSIDYHPLTQSLVVTQTADVQEQVADLLEALRRLNGAQRETVAGCVPAGTPPIEPGARVMADGMLKAARLAVENNEPTRAADLARQAYALDPERMRQDAAAHKLYVLLHEQAATVGRINNCSPACAAGCDCKPPCVCLTRPVLVCEPSLRPNLPGVDLRVVVALERVLVEAEAKRPRLVLVIEEEQEPHVPEASVEMPKPFVLAASPKQCAGWMKNVTTFRLLNVPVRDPETGVMKRLTFGPFGWYLEETTTGANHD